MGARSDPRVAVIGGGLAGLAACVGLVELGVQVDLYESRRMLGGRAGSFRDAASGEWTDHCQHVSMGCCTNLQDFCERTGIDRFFRPQQALHFIAPNGRRFDFRAAAWLPAPLHLGPALWGLKYLSRGERVAIARALRNLARLPAAGTDELSVGEWLRTQRQSSRAIEQFWAPVLVSALSETVEHSSLRYAQKVFVDGFMRNRRGWEVHLPQVPLQAIYGDPLKQFLGVNGVRVHCETPVKTVHGSAAGALEIELADGRMVACDAVVVAVPWHKAQSLLSPELLRSLPELEGLDRLQPAAITAVHLWFDRPLTDLPHAVLVGRVSQWLFRRPESHPVATSASRSDQSAGCYYQVVVSASHDLAVAKAGLAEHVAAELQEAFPRSGAKVVRAKLVTEKAAVFSVQPGLDQYRPSQQTSVPNLALAGDWTATGWPATMEGAVRSGYLASEAIGRCLGRARSLLVADLPQERISRWTIGSAASQRSR